MVVRNLLKDKVHQSLNKPKSLQHLAEGSNIWGQIVSSVLFSISAKFYIS